MKILLFANTDWFLYNFRLSFAKYLSGLGHRVVMVAPAGPYGRLIEEAGFEFVPFEMTRRGLNPLAEGNTLRRLAALYRSHQPDLVHHFTIKCVVYGTLAARWARVPAIVNAIEGLGFVFVSETLKARVLRPVVGRLIREACDRPNVSVLLLNQDDLATIRASGVSSSAKLRVIRGSGIDTGRFRPAAARAVPDCVTVLFVGRLLYDKGLEEFERCASLCRARLGSSIRFIAAGEPDPGNPASVEPDVLARWKAAGNVDFVGHVVDMPGLLSGADIVVLPSYGEGIPRSLVEAAACGKPLIATDVRGCREVVRDGENGLLVPVRDASALADAVLRLATDPSLRARMGAAGVRDVHEQWDEQIVFRETLRAYEELLAVPVDDGETPSMVG